jgi:hypothetical protein
MREPTAAQSLYGHLPSAAREPVEHPSGSVAEAMWPGLTPKPPPGWRPDDIAVIRRAFAQGQSDAEVARRFGVSKTAVEQIRKLRR